MSNLLTEKELVGLLRVSRSTARRFAEKAGARRLIGNALRYDADVINAALQEQQSGLKSKRGGAR